MNCQKHLFSLRPNVHYLNCATKAPLLKSSEEACLKALTLERNPMDKTNESFFDVLPVIQKYFAQLINVEAQQIALIPSASYAFSSILNNTPAKENGHAITIQDEFPSGYFAIEKWCKTNRNEMKVVSPDDSLLKAQSWNNNIIDEINQHTSVVLISSTHWMNGITFDLERIGEKCKDVGARFVVDGTQSVGAVEIDVKKLHIDALVCAGYKWLFGPYSLSLAYFSEDYNEGIPIEESWMNRTNAHDFSSLSQYESEYMTGASRYHVGQQCNFILLPILRESLKQVLQWGPSSIQQYCADLIKPLLHYLQSLGVELEPAPYFSNHLFALPLPVDVDLELLKQNLISNNIFLSVRGDSLRVAVNVYNDATDIQKLIDVIEDTRVGHS